MKERTKKKNCTYFLFFFGEEKIVFSLVYDEYRVDAMMMMLVRLHEDV